MNQNEERFSLIFIRKSLNMKLFVVLFAVIAAALAAPQFGGGFGGSGENIKNNFEMKWK